jgi:hypothetical protein
MVNNLNNFQLSKFLFKDLKIFADLMDMGLPSFEAFLENCYFKTAATSIQVRHWKNGHKKDYAIAELSTSLITDDFLSKFIGISPEVA